MIRELRVAVAYLGSVGILGISDVSQLIVDERADLSSNQRRVSAHPRAWRRSLPPSSKDLVVHHPI